jgi:uncharacterized protein (UPF0333 family)
LGAVKRHAFWASSAGFNDSKGQTKMALRFQLLTNILAAGNTIAHNLVGGTPVEYTFTPNLYGAASSVYFLGVSSTNVTLAVSVGGMTGLVACSIPHTWIQ